MGKKTLLVTMFILPFAVADVLGSKLLKMARIAGRRSQKRGNGGGL